MNPPPPADKEEELDFNLILENDLANIIKKSAAGQPLTKREREMVEQERDRRNKGPGGFQLVPEKPAGPLAGLSQIELSEKWGYSVRQIKNWVADGRKANDPVPIDDPAQMPAWFARIYAPRAAPDRLLRACQKLSELSPPAASDPPKAPEIHRIEVSEAEKGLLAMLERMRTAEAAMYNRYMEAVDLGHRDKANYLSAEWQKIAEKLRALEKSAPQSLADAGIYVRKDDVVRETLQLHTGIIKAFKQAFRKARIQLRATQSTDDWNLTVDDVVDETCLALVDSDFREPLELLPE